jgi:hypothetical protein
MYPASTGGVMLIALSMASFYCARGHTNPAASSLRIADFRREYARRSYRSMAMRRFAKARMAATYFEGPSSCGGKMRSTSPFWSWPFDRARRECHLIYQSLLALLGRLVLGIERRYDEIVARFLDAHEVNVRLGKPLHEGSCWGTNFVSNKHADEVIDLNGAPRISQKRHAKAMYKSVAGRASLARGCLWPCARVRVCPICVVLAGARHDDPPAVSPLVTSADG